MAELDHLERRAERARGRRPARSPPGRLAGRGAPAAAPLQRKCLAPRLETEHPRHANAVRVEKAVDRGRRDVERRNRRRDDRAGDRHAPHVLDVDERVRRLPKGEHERPALLEAHVGGALQQVAADAVGDRPERAAAARARRPCRRPDRSPTRSTRRRPRWRGCVRRRRSSRRTLEALRPRPRARTRSGASSVRATSRAASETTRCRRARSPAASAISTKRFAEASADPPETPTTISRAVTAGSLHGAPTRSWTGDRTSWRPAGSPRLQRVATLSLRSATVFLSAPNAANFEAPRLTICDPSTWRLVSDRHAVRDTGRRTKRRCRWRTPDRRTR